MRVVPIWTKYELNGGARYSSPNMISQMLDEAEMGITTTLKCKMREETAYLEKVLDTLELTNFKPDKMKIAAERLTKCLEQYITGILERGIPIQMEYLIWATMALRRKYEMLTGDELVDTEDVLRQAIST